MRAAQRQTWHPLKQVSRASDGTSICQDVLTFRCLATLDGTRNGMIVHLSPFHLAQCLRARSNNLHIPTIEVEHVRTGVEPSEMSIDVERMQTSRSSQALRWDSLDNVALDDMLLQLRDEAFISLFANIADGLIAHLDGALGRKRDMGRFESTPSLVNFRYRFFVQ